MKLKSKLSIFICALIFTVSSFAAQQIECPSIDVIKSEGFSMSEQVLKNLYFTFHLSQYSSDSVWAFVMAPIESDSDVMALETGNKILSTMTSAGIPEFDEEGVVVCEYDTGDKDVVSTAVKANHLLSPIKLRKLFTRPH